MSTHAEVIVLGCGGVGSAAAYHLARRGISVLALEQFEGPHDRGSSHGETRIIRQAYFEHPDYVPLLLRAYTQWHELERFSDQQLFYPVGLLQVGHADGPVLTGLRKSRDLHKLPLVELTAKEIQSRYPGISVPEGMTGLLELTAGFLRVEDCVRAHQAAARQSSAKILNNCTVTSWSSTPERLSVHTNQGTFTCNRLVVTAGPWAPQLLRQLNIPLVVRRKHLYWLDASESGPYSMHHPFPTFLFDLPDGCFYGFPVIDALGLKAAEHSGGQEVTDPLHDERLPDAADAARVQAFLKQCLPQVSSKVNKQGVCYYTMSPDEHFLVDTFPDDPRVCFAAGLSGHGFKFTSVLGEILADLSLEQGTSLPAEFLGISRFSQNTN